MTGLSLLLMRLTQPCEARDGDLALDPNAALARLRDLAAQLLTADPEPGAADTETRAAQARELAEVFAGLDTWLTNCGYLPGSWATA